ncbi:MAG: hypothetical protein EB100_06820, partial [Crocinitomicaceae bacterium]|nr:hypothetical protein [Crocinitomicaceae bacterium]
MRKLTHNGDAILTTIFSLISTIPLLPFILDFVFNDTFHFFDFGGSRDQGYYIARANAIFLGKSPAFLSGDPQNTDLRQGIISNLLNFIPGHSLGLNYRFFPLFFYLSIILPLFCLIFVSIKFFGIFTKSYLQKISLFFSFFFIPNLFDGKHFNLPDQILLYRWPAPLLHYLLIFSCLYLIFSGSAKTWKLVIIFWYSLYLYFYTWPIVFLIVVLYWIYEAYRLRISGFGQFARRLILLSLPLFYYFLNLFNVKSNLSRIEYFNFEVVNKLEKTHDFTFTLSALILAMLIIVALRLRLESHYIYCGIIFFIVSLIVMNQNVITGLRLQPGHFHWYFEYPFTIFYFLLILHQLVSRYSLNYLNIVIGIISLILILFVQTHSLNYSKNAVLSRLTIQSIKLSDYRDFEGSFLTFDPNVSYLLVTSSKLDPFFDQDYGLMYPPNIQRTLEYSVANLKWNVGSVKKSKFSYSDFFTCLDNQHSICDSLRAIQKSYSVIYGQFRGNLVLQKQIESRARYIIGSLIGLGVLSTGA